MFCRKGSLRWTDSANPHRYPDRRPSSHRILYNILARTRHAREPSLSQPDAYRAYVGKGKFQDTDTGNILWSLTFPGLLGCLCEEVWYEWLGGTRIAIEWDEYFDRLSGVESNFRRQYEAGDE